jgi:hypothetical protein
MRQMPAILQSFHSWGLGSGSNKNRRKTKWGRDWRLRVWRGVRANAVHPLSRAGKRVSRKTTLKIYRDNTNVTGVCLSPRLHRTRTAHAHTRRKSKPSSGVQY